MWPNPEETADLITVTEEILNGKLKFSMQWNIRQGSEYVSGLGLLYHPIEWAF